MANNKLSIELEPRIDEQGRKYYIGKLQAPITIECKDEAVFLVFVSENGAEELQVCNSKPPKNKIRLEKYDRQNQKF
jgi:hypothetical protein